MDPLNSKFYQFNFLQDLPIDILGDICSFLSIKHLGNLDALNSSFNSLALKDVTWKSLNVSCLPKAYKSLPGSILKEKLKSDHESLKAKLGLVLNNRHLKINHNGHIQPLFSDKLLDQLKSKDLSLIEKCAAIKADTQLATYFKLIFYKKAFLLEKPADGSEDFDFLVKLANLNTFDEEFGDLTYPVLFQTVACCLINSNSFEGRDAKIVKTLIDAGADFELVDRNGLCICEFAHIFFKIFRPRKRFPQELFDEIAAYAAQKASANNESST